MANKQKLDRGKSMNKAKRIFSKHIFPALKERDIIKPDMNGFNDPTLPDFQLLTFSSLFKPEIKNDGIEREYIKSFLNAAKILADEGKRKTTPFESFPFYHIFEYSFALPVLYLSRHCVELSIKRAIFKSGGNPKNIHDLEKLWTAFSSCHPGQKNKDDRRIINRMLSFIELLSSIDPNGTNLRYPKDNNENPQDIKLFVNNQEVVHFTEKFIEQLDLLIS